MRIVDPEDAYALRDPVVEYRSDFAPQAAPVLVLEIEWIDVFVLLRRVLGELRRAVRPLPEPLRVRADVLMIGRALQRAVQRDVDADGTRGGKQLAEFLDRAELAVDGCMAAVGAAERPGAAAIVERSDQSV